MKHILLKLLTITVLFTTMNSFCVTPIVIIPTKPQDSSIVDFTKQCLQRSFAGVALASLGYSSYQLCRFIKYGLFVKSENANKEIENENIKNSSLNKMFAGLLVAMGTGAVATSDLTTMNFHFDIVQAASLVASMLQNRK